MLEKTVERRLKTEIEKKCFGAMCLKLESPGYNGLPDRLILLPGGAVVFVETKRPGKTERPRQEYVQGKLRALGFTVFSSVRTPAGVASVLSHCLSESVSRVCEGCCNSPSRIGECLNNSMAYWTRNGIEESGGGEP